MTDKVERIVDALRVICSEYECCECPSDAWCHNKGQCLDWDAADLIESLSAELEQVKRERDAAVKDLRTNKSCCTCINDDTKDHLPFACSYCGDKHINWRWRGVKEE